VSRPQRIEELQSNIKGSNLVPARSKLIKAHIGLPLNSSAIRLLQNQRHEVAKCNQNGLSRLGRINGLTWLVRISRCLMRQRTPPVLIAGLQRRLLVLLLAVLLPVFGFFIVIWHQPSAKLR
jgi:hypothetical protein